MIHVPTRLTLTRETGMDEKVMRALGESADRDNRDPRDQAVHLLRQALRMQGYLDGDQRQVTLVLTEERAKRLQAWLVGELGD